jgi:hypothetical protein
MASMAVLMRDAIMPKAMMATVIPVEHITPDRPKRMEKISLSLINPAMPP